MATYVSRHIPVENHCNHDAQENDNCQRVDQTQPVNTRIKDMQIVIPSSSLKSVKTSLSCYAYVLALTHGVSDSYVQFMKLDDLRRTWCTHCPENFVCVTNLVIPVFAQQ